MLINFLKKIKSKRIWFFIVKYFLKPLYDFIWINIINIHGRLLFFLWFLKGNKKTSIDNDKMLLENDEIKFLSKKILNDLNSGKLPEIINKLNTSNEKSENLTNSENNKFKEDITNNINLDTKKLLYEFSLSKKIISLVSSYLKVLPILNNISIYVNIPKNIKNVRGSMNWHRDDFGYKSMDIFIPISNIDDDNGPLYCVKEKEKLGRFINYSNEINSPQKGDRGKIKEEYFKFSSNDEKKIIKLSGSIGKALFIDSFNCYHKGGHCTKNFRIMLRITYSTIDTYLTNENYYNDVINDIKKYSKRDIFTNYILEKKSWFIKRFKLYKFLVLSYRFLSFKG